MTKQQIHYNLEGAIAFVSQYGPVMEKARLQRLLDQPVDPAFLKPLFDLQNRDGGLPSRPRPGSLSSVDSTLTALWQMFDLGLFDTPQASRALDFIESMQRQDGSWDENPALPPYDLPPWIRPDHLPTQVYLTAYSAYWLGLTRRETKTFSQAITFLTGQHSAAGQLPGYTHTNWIGTAAFLLAGSPARAAADRGLAYLQAQPLEDWEPSQIAWALDNLLTAGLPAGHAVVQRGVTLLLRSQSPGGTWASEDGPSYAAAATVSALKVLRRFEASTAGE